MFGATKPTVSGPARWITVAAVVCAAAAVACALAAQILTISKHVNPENLAQVRAWYKGRIETRGYPTRAATFLLLVAAVLAGAAAVVALATATPNEPTIAVTRALDHAAPVSAVATTPATATVTAEVTFRGLTSGQTASVTVTASTTGQVLASGTVTPATDGTATRTLTITGLPATEPVTVLAPGGQEQCRSTLGTGSAPPTLSCGPAS